MSGRRASGPERDDATAPLIAVADHPVVVEAAGSRSLTAAPARSAPTSTLVWSVAVLSALALWCAFYGLVVGSVKEDRSQQQLFATFRQQLAEATAPLGPVVAGDPVALLQAGPHVGRTVVVEGTSSVDLQSGPGHRRDSVLPGQAGVSVVYAKGATFGAPLRGITDLRPGSVVTATTGQGVFTYRVERLRRAGDPLPPVLAAGASRLVLVTTEGAGWRNGWAPTSTVYVDALLSGAAQLSPGGRTAVPAAEKVMGRSTAPLLVLVLWLEALLVVVVGAVWAASRWGRWQTWVAAGPVLLAALLGATGTAAELLPNLL